MRSASFAAAGKATLGTVQLDGQNFSTGLAETDKRPVGRHFRTAANILREMFPQKPAREIAWRSGVQVRAAERWLAGTREMGAEQLLTFIASDKGADFIAALINDLPRNRRMIFWARIDRAARRALKEERIARLREEIDREEQLDLPVGRYDRPAFE